MHLIQWAWKHLNSITNIQVKELYIRFTVYWGMLIFPNNSSVSERSQGLFLSARHHVFFEGHNSVWELLCIQLQRNAEVLPPPLNSKNTFLLEPFHTKVPSHLFCTLILLDVCDTESIPMDSKNLEMGRISVFIHVTCHKDTGLFSVGCLPTHCMQRKPGLQIKSGSSVTVLG